MFIKRNGKDHPYRILLSFKMLVTGKKRLFDALSFILSSCQFWLLMFMYIFGYFFSKRAHLKDSSAKKGASAVNFEWLIPPLPPALEGLI